MHYVLLVEKVALKIELCLPKRSVLDYSLVLTCTFVELSIDCEMLRKKDF